MPPNNLIFVSIAAYRDPQLVPTVNDLIAKAQHPDRLRFGICWQHGGEEPALPFAADSRFRILDVDWRVSKGACWARAEVMKLWQGEDWFLQVDSHCRFAAQWDRKVLEAVEQAKALGSEKPIISTYGTAFRPGECEILQQIPLMVAFETFTHEKVPELKPVVMPRWQQRTAPMRARFIGAGFVFTSGSFVLDVPYDPGLYFMGEEATMTVRAYTSGYDIFHPHQPLVWHDYVRAEGSRHWDHHTGKGDAPRAWSELDSLSKEKVRRLLTGKPVESFGLGVTRTLEQYQDYAGINFALRKAEAYTLECGDPPNPAFDPHWPEKIYLWIARITIDFLSLPPGSVGDADHWLVAIRNEKSRQIYERRFPKDEIATLTGLEDKIVLICEFQSSTIPDTWVILPVSRMVGNLDRLEGRFAEDDYAIVLDEDDDGEDVAPAQRYGEDEEPVSAP